MAEAKRYTLTNTTAGPRGVHQDDGSYVELEPKQTRTVDLTDAEYASAKSTGYFVFGAAAAKEVAASTPTATGGDELPSNVMKLKKIARDEGIDAGEAHTVAELQAAITAGRAAKAGGGTGNITPPDDLDTLPDDVLRTTVQAITGKEPPADADRDALLKLARGVE